MRKALVLAGLIFLTFLLQSALRALLPAAYTVPNLLIILTCSMGLMRGHRSGLLTGFFCGLLYDLLFGNIFGFTALCFLDIGDVNGYLYEVFFDEDIRIPMLAAGVSCLAYRIVYYVVEYAIHGHSGFGWYLTGTILPEVIATILFTIVFYTFFRLINRKIVAYELEAQQSPWLRK